MWLSTKENPRNSGRAMPEEAKITLGGVEPEANGTYQTRGIAQYGPYGYQSGLPGGTDILTVPAPSGRAAVGVAQASGGLLPGEIKITAGSGAYLFLRSDGCAEINGLVITAAGEIMNRKAGEKP